SKCIPNSFLMCCLLSQDSWFIHITGWFDWELPCLEMAGDLGLPGVPRLPGLVDWEGLYRQKSPIFECAGRVRATRTLARTGDGSQGATAEEVRI
ncbi:MAG: hypothetical protein WEB58_19150, partial [Planctomycetaceae bacterium]